MIKINVALIAEQVVSAAESDCPRRPFSWVDCTGNFNAKLSYLDKAEVSAYWLYGFRSAEGTMRDIGLLKAAKEKLERLGKEAYIVCEPVGHPNPNQKTLPGRGWRHRINCDGKPDYGCADIEENLVRDLVAATTAFRDADFTKVFFDDDLRMAFGHGRVRWGDTAGGCFCDACIAAFNRRNATRFTRADLREIVMNPEKSTDILEDWITFNCDKVTDFMKAVNLPGLQVGIMVMCMGSRNHGIDLAAIQRAVPDCLVRVGEGHFNDASFDPSEGKAAEIESIRMHMAQVGDVSRLYSENTVDPWPKLRPENTAKKLLIEVENGLRNIMLMPPPLIDAPEYWEAIAAALPEAKDICRRGK